MKVLPRVLFVLWLAAIVFGIAYPTLRLPYISDDFEHGQLIAEIRAGLRPGSDLITVPFHGQTLVLLNLIFWFGTMAGGMSLFWVRVAICAAHIAGATGCAILCTRWAGSRMAGFMAGTFYAGALGFINEQIWWPSSAIFCLGGAFFILALVAIENDALGWAVVLMVIAALGLNGVLMPALVLPIYCWLYGRRRDASVLGGVIVALLAIALLQQSIHHDREPMVVSVRALELGAWLIGTAPLRFFEGFTTFAIPGFRTILKLSPLAWIPLLASAWFLRRRFGRILLLVWSPAIVMSIMIGLARADYHPDRYGPGVLYVADRYYYFFLFPLVVHLVLFAYSVRVPRWTSLIVLGAALVGSAAHFRANFELGHFDSTGPALARGHAVVDSIRSAPVRPLLLTDETIPIDGAHKNKMTLAFLIYAEYPRGLPGVHLVHSALDPQQAASERSLLNPWLKPLSSRIDFKDRSYEQNLVSGFSWWEPPFRWMTGRGEIRLATAPGDLVIFAYAPVDQLHRPVHVAVEINGHAVGELAISLPGIQEYSLKVPDLTAASPVDIVLTSDVVWHARDLFPDSLDERNLSIALSSIGFVVRP